MTVEDVISSPVESAFELLESKLRPPRVRDATVSRQQAGATGAVRAIKMSATLATPPRPGDDSDAPPAATGM
jgi:hypothetical protein